MKKLLCFVLSFVFCGCVSYAEIKAPLSVLYANNCIYVVSGRSILKFSLEGKFVRDINEEVSKVTVNRNTGKVLVGKWIGRNIGTKEIKALSQYLNVEPTLPAVINRIIVPKRMDFADDKIYVLGEDLQGENYRIAIMDSNDGHTISVFGRSGSGEADLFWPKDLAVDKDGYIYVTNHVYSKEGKKLSAVKKFDKKGDFITSWSTWGGGDAEFKDPWAIAIDKNNNYVYVTDSFYPSWMRGTGEDHPQEKVVKFSMDGKYIKKWGGNSVTGVSVYPPRLLVKPDFSDPIAMAIDSNGNVYVLEDDRARVSKFDTNGNLILRWGKNGIEQGEFKNPQDIAIDQHDNIYVADTGNDRVQKFTASGKFLRVIK